MLADCRNRDFDTTVIYYGSSDISSIDEKSLRNHTWKCRDANGRIPKGGMYCMPEEIQSKLDEDSINKLNNRFRNVQYIQSGMDLYWVYCMKSDNLYKFNFIGDNVSPGVISTIMTSNGFELGYTHIIDDTSYVDCWYHPTKLYIVTFEFCDNIVVDKKVYFRRFEQDITKTSYTSYIFNIKNDKYITVPLMTEEKYHEYQITLGDDILPWSYEIFMLGSFPDTNSNGMLTTKDFENDSESFKFSQINYNDMLEKIFNVTNGGEAVHI